MIEYIVLEVFIAFLFGVCIGILIREVLLVRDYGWGYEEKLKIYEEMSKIK